MDEAQERPEAGTISLNDIREAGILDEYLPCTEDVLECMKNPRTPSEIIRTKEYVRVWAKKAGVKGNIKMYGVEVDCGD